MNARPLTTPLQLVAPDVRVAAEARLPTRHGEFRVVVFDAGDGKEHSALIHGEVSGQRGVPVRLHSECFTGDVMGSLRCDCREQLEAALAHVGAAARGVVIYLRQEGRGIGLANKIKAYALQESGLDTVEANLELGFADDERRYDVAAAILLQLGVVSVRLLTNNPRKWEGLEAHGIEVEERVPLQIPANEHNADYLATKKAKSGHLL